MKSLFMETTAIAPERTIAQIEAVLMRFGATAIYKEAQGGYIQAVSFKVPVGDIEIPFRLPCRWQQIETMLNKRHRGVPSNAQGTARREKAKRVAWRQILRWVEAQMALVETSMVTVEEVFFPYIQTKSGQTVYEMNKSNLLQLGSGQ